MMTREEFSAAFYELFAKHGYELEVSEHATLEATKASVGEAATWVAERCFESFDEARQALDRMTWLQFVMTATAWGKAYDAYNKEPVHPREAWTKKAFAQARIVAPHMCMAQLWQMMVEVTNQAAANQVDFVDLDVNIFVERPDGSFTEPNTPATPKDIGVTLQ